MILARGIRGFNDVRVSAWVKCAAFTRQALPGLAPSSAAVLAGVAPWWAMACGLQALWSKGNVLLAEQEHKVRQSWQNCCHCRCYPFISCCTVHAHVHTRFYLFSYWPLAPVPYPQPLIPNPCRLPPPAPHCPLSQSFWCSYGLYLDAAGRICLCLKGASFSAVTPTRPSKGRAFMFHLIAL